MEKKKTCWLQLYKELIQLDEMPYHGLCGNLWKRNLHKMETQLSVTMRPPNAGYFSYWADHAAKSKEFTPQRQNIVLLMACLNNEL